MISYFGKKPPSLGGVAVEADSTWQQGGPLPSILVSLWMERQVSYKCWVGSLRKSLLHLYSVQSNFKSLC